MEIPPFIDIFPNCFRKKNHEVTDYLKKRTFLSDNRKNVIRKFELQEYMSNDPDFSSLVIPTHKLIEFEDLKQNVEQYKKVVLKSFRGSRGKGIYILEKSGESYLVGHKFTEKYFNEDEFEQFFDEELAPNNYMLQKYISSRTIQGDPFDCRVHIEKNEKGEWGKRQKLYKDRYWSESNF